MNLLSTALLHLLGAALAAAVVALLMGFVFGAESSRLGFVFFVYAYFFALLVGLPGYLMLRSLNGANWFTVSAVGFVVGLLVVGLFEFWTARIIKVEMLYAVPWFAVVANSAVFALMGSAGALAFWLVVKGAPGAAEEGATLGPRLAAAAVAVALSGGLIYLQPEILKDRSCHSRDYGSGPPHLTSLRIQIEPNEWPVLLTLLDAFGRKHGLSVRSELWRPPQRWDQNVDFSLCRNGLANIYGGDGTDGVYIHFRGSDQQALRSLYSDLYRGITIEWPEKTTFVWEGQPTARPAWLDET